MLAILSATLNTHSKITTHLCSEPPEQNYDLVTANFSLQWFPSIKTTVQRCLNSLRPEGLLAISLPIEGTFKSLKDAIDTTQVNISLPKLPTESQVLEAFPLNSKLHIETIELYDNYPNTLAFLKGLHKIGAIEEGAKTATSDLRALIKQHDKLFPESISVNYKILQVIYKR
jgi:2-polyprenyl-3-methyl-5-hydroxy-6-metoxy-1,4-benzoquinol methylase